MLVRSQAVRKSDQRRRYYLLSFPRELDFESVVTFVRSLSGLGGQPDLLSRIPASVVFEIQATQGNILYRLGAPARLADYIIGQLRGQIPSISVTYEKELETPPWDHAVELKVTSNLPLRIASPPAVISTVLASVVSLKADETLLLQWIVAGAAPGPTTTPQEKQKQSDQMFVGVGRIASRAADRKEAERLVKRVCSALSTVRAYGVSIEERRIPGQLVRKRLHWRASPLAFPCSFNAWELATLIAFPVEKISVPGLPQGQSRHLAAHASIPSEGLVIGSSNFPGGERPLAIRADDLLRHMWIVGPTGTGKSTSLHNLANQIMRQGYGMLLLEPKGDLVHDVLNSVPKERINDVILFDPADTQFPIGLNILADPDPERITGHVVALFKSIYGDSWGPRLEMILRYAVLTAALSGLTLYDVKQLLLSPSFRRGVIRGLKRPEVREFWQWYEKTADNASDSVVNKLDAFLGYSVIRNIVGQPVSGFSMTDVMAKGKIVLVPLTSGLVGDTNASMLGSLIVSLTWQAARGRSGIVREDRQPFFILVDEFQNYLNLPVAIGDALAQARGYGVGMVLANQHLAQLKPDVRASVMANARSKVVFQAAADDARALKDEFAPYLEASDLQTLGRYQAVLKLMVNDESLPPATADLPPPPRSTGSARAVRSLSRQSYGRPVGEVERDFSKRHKTLSEDVKRPSIGVQRNDI